MTAYWKNNNTPAQQLVRVEVDTDGDSAVLTIVDHATGDEIAEITTDDPAQIRALETGVGKAGGHVYMASLGS